MIYDDLDAVVQDMNHIAQVCDGSNIGFVGIAVSFDDDWVEGEDRVMTSAQGVVQLFEDDSARKSLIAALRHYADFLEENV